MSHDAKETTVRSLVTSRERYLKSLNGQQTKVQFYLNFDTPVNMQDARRIVEMTKRDIQTYPPEVMRVDVCQKCVVCQSRISFDVHKVDFACSLCSVCFDVCTTCRTAGNRVSSCPVGYGCQK